MARDHRARPVHELLGESLVEGVGEPVLDRPRALLPEPRVRHPGPALRDVGPGPDRRDAGIAVAAADITLLRSGISALPTALALARHSLRIIRENLFWAFAFNIIGIPVAAGVLVPFGGPALNPMLAGAAMALSSVTVVSNALRLRFFQG